MEDEADLDKVKNYTAAVFVGFSALAVVAGFAVPGNAGATLTYVFGAVPLLFMGVWPSAAPPPSVARGQPRVIRGRLDSAVLDGGAVRWERRKGGRG